MGKVSSDIQVRILIGKRECDRFMNGLSHKATIDRTFQKKDEAVRFLQMYRNGYRKTGFAIFLNHSLPIKTLEFAGLEFVQYEFR